VVQFSKHAPKLDFTTFGTELKIRGMGGSVVLGYKMATR
jgi:hypothetical protein